MKRRHLRQEQKHVIEETNLLDTPLNYEIWLYFSMHKIIPQKFTFSIGFTNIKWMERINPSNVRVKTPPQK